MSFFNNTKVGTRLMLSFGIIVLLTGAIAAVAVNRLAVVNDLTREIADERWPVSVMANQVIDAANANGRAALQMLVLTDRREIEAAQAEMAAATAVVEATLPRLEEAVVTQEGKALLATVQQARLPYINSLQRVSSLVESNERAEAQAVAVTQLIPRLDTYLSAIDALIQHQAGLVGEAGVAAAATYGAARTTLLLVAGLALLLAMSFGYALTRSIRQPLERAVWLMRELGAGHLSERVDLDQKDELGDLVGVMNQFANDLKVYMLGVMDRLSRGDLDVELIQKDEKDEISPVLHRLRESLQALVDESRSLSEAALAGRLGERADAGRLQGGYRQVIDGFNSTLDAISAPIQEASSVLERVADRDLSARMKGSYKGDYEIIKTSLNTALENLEGALGEVSAVAAQVATAADQISGGSQSLAEGASEQASSLEEVSSSLQELASMSTQNTGNAREARGLAEAAGSSTDTGAEAMRRLSTTVQRIKESSDATGRIVKTIDEIAFQTNLLALNAAVEAARAGEAGKGFAVVAEEVRNLAMRSAEAAKETSRLIEESVSSSEEGVVVQGEVVKQLDEIRTGVTRVREVMAEITAASEQQTEGVGQINQAVEEMNAVTQRSAASSEESASAAEELSGQAQRMSELVAQFTLSAGTGRRSDVTAPRPIRAERTRSPRPGGNGHGKVKVAATAPRIAPADLIPLDDDDSDSMLREF